MNKAQLRQLIAENRLDEVIRELLALTRQTHLHQDALMLSARFNEYKSLQIKGVESSDDLELRRNQITHALLAVVEQLPEYVPPGSDVLSPTGLPVFSGTGDGKGLPRSGTGDGRLPSKMPFWFSVVAFVVLLAISLLVPGWAQQNNALFKTLLALAAAGVAATLPGFLHFDWNNLVKAGGALAAFVLVFLVNPMAESEPFDLTIYVHGREGKQDLVLKNEGEVMLDLKDFDYRQKVEINKSGEALFKNLPHQYLGSKALVSVEARIYKAVQPNTEYILTKNGKLYVEVATKGLDKVWGTVRADGQFLQGAQIRIGDLKTESDGDGRFKLDIPLEHQKPELTLVAQKQGYITLSHTKIYETKVYPSTLEGEGLPIILTKEK